MKARRSAISIVLALALLGVFATPSWAGTEYPTVWRTSVTHTACTNCAVFLSGLAYPTSGHDVPRLLSVIATETCLAIWHQEEVSSTTSGGNYYVRTWVDIYNNSSVCTNDVWRLVYVDDGDAL